MVAFDIAVDGVTDHIERRLQLRDLEHEHRKHDGDGEPDGGLPPRHRATIFADGEGDREQGEDAEDRLDVLHALLT